MNLENNVSTVSASPNRAARRKQKLYPCSQPQLYIICSLVWKYYLEKLDAFSALRPVYTRQFGDDALAAVTAAQKLYNLQQRNMVTSGNRKKAIAAVQLVCSNWRTLKVAIKKAFSGADRTSNIISAGSAFYPKAIKNDWQSLSNLITSSTTFIDLHRDELKQNENVSDDFIKKYINDANKCTEMLEVFKDSSVNKQVNTIVKVSGDQAIFEAATLMMEDGKNLFVDDKATRVKFVFSNLYKIAKSQSPASIKGYIRDAEGNPLKDAIVKIEKSELVAVTNKSGFFSFNRLSGDNSYMLEITKLDFIDLYEGVILKPGTAKHLNLQLTPVVVEQPVQMHQQNGEATAQAV